MKLKNIAKMSLAVALVFGAATAITGCNEDDTTQTEKTEQEKIYDLYVSYMAAQGETPASYQDWLKSIKGDKGDPGEDGEDGQDGEDGENGAKWYTGSSLPASSLGVNGDFYLKTDTGDVYVKEAGVWGEPKANIKGPQGEDAVAPEITIDPVDGTWLIGGVDSNKPSTGEAGETPTVEINEQGYWEINGEPTGVLAQGTNGKDGSKWHHGEGEPTVVEGAVEGDYYVDYSNKDIYFYDGEWTKLFSLDEDVVEEEVVNMTLEDGDYSYVAEKGEGMSMELDINLSDGKITTSASLVSLFEPGTNISEMNLYITSVNEDNIELGFMPGENITVDANKEYTVNHELNVPAGEYNPPMVISLLGTVKGDGVIVELEYSQEIGEEYISINSYETVGNKLKVNTTFDGDDYVMYFELGEKVAEVTPLIETYYFSEEDKVFLQGSYINRLYDNMAITIYGNKALMHYAGTDVTSTYELLAGNMETGEAKIKIETEYATFIIGLELHERSFYMIDEEYVYEGEYKLYFEDTTERVTLIEHEEGYALKQEVADSDPIIIPITISYKDDAYLYIEVPVEENETATFIVNLVNRTIVYSNDNSGENDGSEGSGQVDPEAQALWNSIREDMAFIESTLYNQPEGANVDELVTDSNWYTSVGTVEGEIKSVQINGGEFTSESYSTFVGNHNYVNNPVWMVDNGELYISSLYLNNIIKLVEGNLNVNVCDENDEYENIVTYNMGDFMGQTAYYDQFEVSGSGNSTVTDNENNVYTYSSTNGANYIRIDLGNDDTLEGAKVYTFRLDSENKLHSGYDTIRSDENGYYSSFYPNYNNGEDYEENSVYANDYILIVEKSNGDILLLRMTLNISLEVPTNE